MKLFGESGLATGGDGGLWVNRYLQSISDPRIFGGSDAISLRGEHLEKLGVFYPPGSGALPQPPGIPEGRAAKGVQAPEGYLYILNLGDGTGLAIYGPLAWRSQLAWRLKSYIDTKFVRDYQYP
ncbi:MAG: hypothetical protein M3518_03550 [Actinomycetota bacterium]|jgi:hypothetical protein|nr:hypothetical protein [Actinomycetota bacterium]